MTCTQTASPATRHVPERTLADARPCQKVAQSRLINALLDGVPHHRRPALMQASEELLVTFREGTSDPQART